jgi:hypothetical protein
MKKTGGWSSQMQFTLPLVFLQASRKCLLRTKSKTFVLLWEWKVSYRGTVCPVEPR